MDRRVDPLENRSTAQVAEAARYANPLQTILKLTGKQADPTARRNASPMADGAVYIKMLEKQGIIQTEANKQAMEGMAGASSS